MLKHLIPLTEQARRFISLYGDTFALLGVKAVGAAMTIQSIRTQQILSVSKDKEGIWVNGVLFCKEW